MSVPEFALQKPVRFRACFQLGLCPQFPNGAADGVIYEVIRAPQHTRLDAACTPIIILHTTPTYFHMTSLETTAAAASRSWPCKSMCMCFGQAKAEQRNSSRLLMMMMTCGWGVAIWPSKRSPAALWGWLAPPPWIDASFGALLSPFCGYWTRSNPLA